MSAPPESLLPLRYARFSRRLKAILIDWIIALFVVFGAVFVAISLRSDTVSRMLGFLVVAVLVLYEPILVSFTGGTLGHTFANLRVVDENHGGNVSFAKALARLALKSLLGWYSFLVMAATRRNQAVHDLLTRSTVQILRSSPGPAASLHHRTHRFPESGHAFAAAAHCRDLPLPVADVCYFLRCAGGGRGNRRAIARLP